MYEIRTDQHILVTSCLSVACFSYLPLLVIVSLMVITNYSLNHVITGEITQFSILEKIT